MDTKALILAVILAMGAHSAWGQSSGTSRNSASRQTTQEEAATRTRELEDSSLLIHCRNMADVARGHTSEFLRSLNHGRANLEAMQPHLREVRSAVDAMLDDHRRVLNGLTPEQWTSAKESITELERLRAGLQTQLQGIDLELRMPAPDSKVLTRYGKKLRVLLEDWRKQHKKLAAAIKVGI